MVEPVAVPDKLKKLVATLEVLTKGTETIKKEKEAVKPVPVTTIKSK
jgi:hypothetical protein